MLIKLNKTDEMTTIPRMNITEQLNFNIIIKKYRIFTKPGNVSAAASINSSNTGASERSTPVRVAARKGCI